MGINNLLQYIKKKYAHLLINEHISYFSYTRIYIDISGFIYKYMCVSGKTNGEWLIQIIKLMSMFKQNCIQIIPIFDGTPPPEKKMEADTRSNARTILLDKIKLFEHSLINYKNCPTSYDFLISQLNKSKDRVVSLLKPKSIDNRFISKSDIVILSDMLLKIKKQHIVVTKDDITSLKNLLTSLGITWIQSTSEAESFACYLTNNDNGESSICSFDSDSIVYLAQSDKNLVVDVKLDGYCTIINTKELLEEMELTPSQFVDFAILLGCDYNKHIKVNKIGPVNALKLLKLYNNIEHFPNDVINKECLLLDRCRELFNPTFEHVDIKTINFDEQAFYDLCKNLSIDSTNIDISAFTNIKTSNLCYTE